MSNMDDTRHKNDWAKKTSNFARWIWNGKTVIKVYAISELRILYV